ncbi:Fe-S oxidoreductase [Desulfonispora thiosulfatigenes DSM 11270]|uniref:Fe-S oxidoreductase n=1 Tax=Desulfonispora thiosulfatigenes DSM 11270 TaxID=656914 RepID=A0A1W1VSW0_DESTI|nr:(Fe-S)-binding protein [Desulfonispora thiosulfatigenes]SMB96462.1 Fe-S oxidoreductase [Desulfonispora thiosulfatigenes DSM 11270]
MEALNSCKFYPKFRDEIIEKFVTDKNKFDSYTCLTCGACTGGCPYSDSELGTLDPRKFVRQCLMGLKDEVLNDNFIWKCNMCGRCTMDCPMGVDVAGIVRTLRGNFGLTSPGSLQKIVDDQINTGNQMAISEEDYLETLEWMEEELQEEMPDATIPIDKEGADFIFLWGPREIKYYTDDIMSIAKIINAAGASWTCSSKVFDATNYALFNGDDEAGKELAQRVSDELKRLKAKYVVVTECGHATRAFKWGPKVWLSEDDCFHTYNFMEMQHKWLKEGKIKVDKSLNNEIFTYHDPCNTARKEGIIDLPREIISEIMDQDNFIEMWPNRAYNLCCGGGGGLLALGKDYKDIRMEKGKLKADQIKNTGAKVCITPCHNCFDQLEEIVKHFEIDVEIKHMHHIVSNSLILNK